MSCSCKKESKKAKQGRFRCERCGVVRKKKGQVCKPEKIVEPKT